MGDRRCADMISLGRSNGKRRLGRPRRRWEVNVKIDLEGKEWGDID
jgi:hypothetical protein